MTDEQQQRVLREARANVDRLADLKPRPAPTVEELLQRRPRQMPEPEPVPEAPKLDTDLDRMIEQRIVQAIGAERERLRETLAALVAEIQDEAHDAIVALKVTGAAREVKLVGLIEQLHELRIENARMRGEVAEVASALASARAGKLLVEPAAGARIVN
jgi:hypothetical protein